MNAVTVEIPPPSVQSRWSTRDNNVQLRLVCTFKTRIATGLEFQDSLLAGYEARRSRNVNPLRATVADFDDEYEVFSLGAAPMELTGSRMATLLEAVRKEYSSSTGRSEWLDDGTWRFGDGRLAWRMASPASWYWDLKWGRDSKHWQHADGADHRFRVERIGGNHVNPWRIVGW